MSQGYRRRNGSGSSAASAPSGAPMVSGRWYLPIQGANLNVAVLTTNQREICWPFLVGVACTLNGIATQVTTGGEAGSVIRLGLRNDVNGLPGTLLADFGTVAGDAVATPTIAISQVLPVGWVWVSVTPQACPTTRPTVVHLSSGWSGRVANTTPGGASGAMSYYQDAVSGALPGAFTPAGTLNIVNVPVAWLKAA